MKKIIYVLISILILASLLLPGCDLIFPTIPPPPTTFPTTFPSPTTSPRPASGELNLYNIDPYTLDPAVAGEATSHQYIVQIYSGLVRLDDTLKVTPDIAESWQLSNGNKTYTFKLKKGVRFQNGREVKAADFKYSWERAANPDTGSTTAKTYLGDIVGVNEMLAGTAAEISGVKVIDDYTLEVTIDVPKSYFLGKVSYPTFYVVDRANVESGANWWRKPNGTGPFKLAQWNQQQLVRLERNDYYYGEQAKIKAVNFLLYAGVPMNLYEEGQIDVTGVSTSNLDAVTDKAGEFYDQLQISQELSFYYFGFNHTKPPFDDVNIRRAFAMAIDKDKVVSLVFRDMVQKADGVIPPAMPGFNKNLIGLDFDVAKAKELIKASKYGDVSKLPLITITTSGEGGYISSYMSAIIDQWRQNLGVEVQVRQMEPERFSYFIKQEKDEMFDFGWIADYPHPQDFVDILFGSGGENNIGEFSNKEADALIDQANAETDAEKSFVLYQQAEQMLVDDAACIPIMFGENYLLVKPYVKGYKVNPLGYARLNAVIVESH